MRSLTYYIILISFFAFTLIHAQNNSLSGGLSFNIVNKNYQNYIGIIIESSVPIYNKINLNPFVKLYSSTIEPDKNILSENFDNRGIGVGIKLSYFPINPFTVYAFKLNPYLGFGSAYQFNKIGGTSNFPYNESYNIIFDNLVDDLVLFPYIGFRLIPKLEKISIYAELQYEIRNPQLKYSINKNSASQNYKKELKLNSVFIVVGLSLIL